MRKFESVVKLLNAGIKIFETEFKSETKEDQKLILKNASINFGMIVEYVDSINSGEIDFESLKNVAEKITHFGTLLESAWNEF